MSVCVCVGLSLSLSLCPSPYVYVYVYVYAYVYVYVCGRAGIVQLAVGPGGCTKSPWLCPGSSGGQSRRLDTS